MHVSWTSPRVSYPSHGLKYSHPARGAQGRVDGVSGYGPRTRLLMSTENVAIGVYFRALLGLEESPTSIGNYLPDQVERWGKKAMPNALEVGGPMTW